MGDALAKDLLLTLMALLGSASFAVVFRTPKRYFIHTVIVGFVASLGIMICPPQWDIGFSTFVTALAVSCLSHFVSRKTRAPAQCFLIPGVIFLVPGTYIYRSFSSVMSGENATAGSLALQALTITLGISFAILLANLLVPPRKAL